MSLAILLLNANKIYASKTLVNKFISLGFNENDAINLAEKCDIEYCTDLLFEALWKEKIRVSDIETFYEKDFTVKEAKKVCDMVFLENKIKNLDGLMNLLNSEFDKYNVLQFCEAENDISLESLFYLNSINLSKDRIFEFNRRFSEKLFSKKTLEELISLKMDNDFFEKLLSSELMGVTVDNLINMGMDAETIKLCVEKLNDDTLNLLVSNKVTNNSIKNLLKRNFSKISINMLINIYKVDLNQDIWQNSTAYGESIDKIVSLNVLYPNLKYLIINLSGKELKCLLDVLDTDWEIKNFITLMRKFSPNNIKKILNQNFCKKTYENVLSMLDGRKNFIAKYKVNLDEILDSVASGLNVSDIEARFKIINELRKKGLELCSKFFKGNDWNLRFSKVVLDEEKVRDSINDLIPDSSFSDCLFERTSEEGTQTRFDQIPKEIKQLLINILAAKNEIKKNPYCFDRVKTIFGQFNSSLSLRDVMEKINELGNILDCYLFDSDDFVNIILKNFVNDICKSTFLNSKDQNRSRIVLGVNSILQENVEEEKSEEESLEKKLSIKISLTDMEIFFKKFLIKNEDVYNPILRKYKLMSGEVFVNQNESKEEFISKAWEEFKKDLVYGDYILIY